MKPLTEASKGTVYVIDDDLSFLKAIGRLLSAAGYEVYTYSSAESFLAVENEARPACVLVDLHMPSVNGLDLQKILRETGRDMGMVFLSGNGNISAAVRAIRHGAHDFLEKTVPKSRLLAAVSEALKASDELHQQRSEQKALRIRFDRLSVREREVLEHVVQGKLNKQIASDLGIAERTVKLHRTAITQKLGVPSVAELTRMAVAADIFKSTCP